MQVCRAEVECGLAEIRVGLQVRLEVRERVQVQEKLGWRESNGQCGPADVSRGQGKSGGTKRGKGGCRVRYGWDQSGPASVARGQKKPRGSAGGTVGVEWGMGEIRVDMQVWLDARRSSQEVEEVGWGMSEASRAPARGTRGQKKLTRSGGGGLEVELGIGCIRADLQV